eukprot:9477472-Pyramimonas_sp.AAC.4
MLPVDEFNQLTITTSENAMVSDVWSKLDVWADSTTKWMTGHVRNLELESVLAMVDDYGRASYKMAKTQKDNAVVARLKAEVEEFKQYYELLQELGNPALGDRHWGQIFEVLGKDFDAAAGFSIQDLLAMGVLKKLEEVQNIGAAASKEYSLLKTLEKMEKEWEGLVFKTMAYKDTGTYVIGGTDEIQMILDDQIVKVQSMNASPFVKPFAARATEWQRVLFNLQEMLDSWLKCQSTWMYLEPIFSSADILKQMPEEGQNFQLVDTDWKGIMSSTFKHPAVRPPATVTLSHCHTVAVTRRYDHLPLSQRHRRPGGDVL